MLLGNRTNDIAVVDVYSILDRFRGMVDGSIAWEAYGAKLFDQSCDGLYAPDMLRSCHAIPNIFEENTGHLTHQYILHINGVLATRAP